jgi:hypothetical protein
MPEVEELKIIHWCSPYDNPRDSDRTEYWFDDKFVGGGSNGLRELIGVCSTVSVDFVAFGFSRYVDGGGWSEFEVPFDEKILGEIKTRMKKHGCRIIELSTHHFDIYPGEPPSRPEGSKNSNVTNTRL